MALALATRSLAERLRACMDEGRLSISDIALWMGRPRPSVRCWIVNEQEPRDTYREEIVRRTKLLEQTILRKRGAPVVPHEVNQLERKTYLRRLYNAADPRVSKNHSAK